MTLRFCLLGLLALIPFGVSLAQVEPPPPPPTLEPEAEPGQPKPFRIDQTREAILGPPLDLRISDPPDPEAPQSPLTLYAAILLAQEIQPDMVGARGALRQTEGTVVSRRSALLPRFSVGSTVSRITTDSGQGGGGPVVVGDQVISGDAAGNVTTQRISTRVGFNQLLFDSGRTRNLVLEADLRRGAAAASLLQTENDLALSVKEGFYELVLSRRLVEVSENDLEKRKEQLRLAKALNEAGLMSPGDVVRAQSAVTNSVVAVNSARLAYENAKQEKVRRIGLPPLSPVDFVESSEPDLSNKEIQYFLQQARSRRPDLLVAHRNVEAAEAALGAAYALNRPSLTAFTGLTYQGLLNGLQVPTLTAQLNLSFDLYDGGARAGAVTSAEGLLEISQAFLRQTELSVERQVGEVYAQLVTAERNVEAAQAGVDSAREGVRIAEGRYRVALGPLTDVFDTQLTFVTAQTNLVRSLADLNLARARVRHVMAAPFEEGFLDSDPVLDSLLEEGLFEWDLFEEPEDET